MSLDYQHTAIIDPSYFSDWQQYKLDLDNGNSIAMRRMPKPLTWIAPRISTVNNPPQYDRNLVLCEDSDVSYQYICDVYIGVNVLNEILSGEGLFNPGVDATAANIQNAILNSGCMAAPNQKAGMPYYGKSFMGQPGEWPFWTPTDTDLGKALASAKEIADGSPIGWRPQGNSGYYYPLQPTSGNTAGAFTASYYRYGPPYTSVNGVLVQGDGLDSNTMTISASIIDWIPIPGSPLQEKNYNWLVPKLFTPYVFFGKGVLCVMWIGLKQNGAGAGSELEGANWFVRKQLCFGKTPSAAYNHFFPCYRWKGIYPDNMAVDIALEVGNLFGDRGGTYIGNDGNQVIFSVSGDLDDATFTFEDGTIYEHMNLTNERVMMNSPAIPTTMGTNFPEMKAVESDG